jgi:hypothetical protein
MNKLTFHIAFSKIGDIAKIGNTYYECIGVDLWQESENQKYDF